jgi:hypothetical protein
LDIDSLAKLCAKVQKQNTTTTQMDDIKSTTDKGERKRKHNINPATYEYKDEGDDVQDYFDRGLRYNNKTTKIWRLSGRQLILKNSRTGEVCFMLQLILIC